MRHPAVRSSPVVLAVALLSALPLLGRAQEGTPAASPGAGGGATVVATATFPDVPLAEIQGAALPDSPIADDRGFLLGGVGSDLWHDPGAPADEFWMVTDRGPNDQVEVGDETRRTFPVPDFTPLILHVRLAGEGIELLEGLPIVGQSGDPVTGLSNIEGVDEAPFDFSGETPLDYDPSGLDSEGLVRTADGEFWLADEYGPSLVHVDAAGAVIARYVPEGLRLAGADYPVEETLPAIYAQRKANRGFEGLALSGDGSTLYATLQSPLSNPDEETGEASRAGRILAFDVASGRPAAEFVYRFEVATAFDPNPEVDQDEMKLSGVVWLDDATLLVLERTDQVARLYAVDLAGATDILDGEWDDPATSPTLESFPDVGAAGVDPLPKRLAVDLEALPGMPDKIEGIAVAVVDGTTLAVANDNDFDINEFDAEGRHLPGGVESRVLTIETEDALAASAATPVVGATPAGTPAAAPAEVSVTIDDYDFAPAGVRVPAGTTVRWTNREGVAHTATGADRAFHSGPLFLGGTFAHRFDEPGTYRYECLYHQAMTGTVLVTGG